MAIIPIFIPQKGCPQRCIFCNQEVTTGVREMVNPNGVKELILSYLRMLAGNPNDEPLEVAFYGGNFTGLDIGLQRSFLRVAKSYLDSGLIKGIRLSTRPDYINTKILDDLQEFRVGIVELGAQSMVEEVLLKSKRGHTAQQIREATRLLKSYGFKVGLHLMLGLPGDSKEGLAYTIAEVIKLKPDFIRVHPTLVLKGTYLEKLYREGSYQPLSLPGVIDLGKPILKEFQRANIPIIRFGLHPSWDLRQEGVVVAGPFHPALRELVEGELAYEEIEKLVNSARNSQPPFSRVTFQVNKKDISRVRGPNNTNVIRLKERFGLKEMEIFGEGNLPRGTILLYSAT